METAEATQLLFDAGYGPAAMSNQPMAHSIAVVQNVVYLGHISMVGTKIPKFPSSRLLVP